MMARHPPRWSGLALIPLLLAPLETALAEPYELSDCKQVVVVLEDPVEPNGTVGPRVAELACETFRRLAGKFDLPLREEVMVRLMIADDPDTFREHTGRGAMTQAIYSKRTGIITQPAKTIRQMARSKRLGALLAHELTHYLVGEMAGPRCPVWLNEGLAQWFEPRPHTPGGPRTESDLAKLELTWRAQVPPQARAWCYRESLAITSRLIGHCGEAALLGALPQLAEQQDPLALLVGTRSIRDWLFPGAASRTVAADEAPGAVEVVRGQAEPGGLTRLPLDQMLKNANKNKKKNPKK